MKKDIEDSDFAVRNRKEIISILDGMRRDRMILNIETEDGLSMNRSEINNRGNVR